MKKSASQTRVRAARWQAGRACVASSVRLEVLIRHFDEPTRVRLLFRRAFHFGANKTKEKLKLSKTGQDWTAQAVRIGTRVKSFV